MSDSNFAVQISFYYAHDTGDHIASWLLRFGERVQKSVFKITVKDERHDNRTWRGMSECIKPEAGDRVRAYPSTPITLKQVRVLGGTPRETPI